MRVLTVQQPWAWAILHGGKDVENRNQQWSYRGPLAIHAGVRLSERGCTAIPEILDATRPELLPRYAETQLSYGAILGVVDLVDAHPDGDCCKPWGESYYHSPDGRWGTSTIVHLVLENPQPFIQPIPARGRLGLWKPDGELLDRIIGSTPNAA